MAFPTIVTRTAASAPHPLLATAARFAPISLREMADVALLDRTDTKYVATASTMLQALSRLADSYRILEVDGARLNRYQTLYFDTAELALYQAHYRGVPDRYKVRSRAYLESELTFLEVKRKTVKNRTVKERVQTPGLITEITADAAAFLDGSYPADPAYLLPALWNRFTRVTLVSIARAERVTLDFNLGFQRDSHSLTLKGIAIAEVKQSGHNYDSDFMGQMRDLAVRPGSFSKYCLGTALLRPEVRHNRFKPQLLILDKLARAA